MTTKLTREQAAIISLYTGISAGPFEDMHKLAEEVLGRPIWTHELANKAMWEQLKEKVKPQFVAICAERE